MCVTVRSTSTMRSRFQLLSIRRKCSSCCLLMYCSPRLRMYGFTVRGPASRLPGSIVSPSSPSAFTACATAARFAVIMVAVAGGGAGGAATRSGLLTSTGGGGAGAGRGARGFFGAAAVLRACPAAALTRPGSGLRPSAFLTAGRLAAFLPFADLGAGLLAGINGSSKQHQPRKERAIIPADPGLYSVLPLTGAAAVRGTGYPPLPTRPAASAARLW